MKEQSSIVHLINILCEKLMPKYPLVFIASIKKDT